MPTALVTGITGFVGGNLGVQLRSAGWSVTGVHRGSSSVSVVETLRGNGITMLPYSDHAGLQDIASTTRPDAVFHLATHQAKSHDSSDIDSFIDSNIALGTHLLEGISNIPCVFVNATSYFQYRNNEPTAFSMYSATKQAFVQISQFYRDRRGADVREVVLYDNFGPRDNRNKLITQLLTSLRDGSPVTLGPSSQRMNALYVDDVASGLIASAQPGNPSVMTVRAETEVTVGEIVAEIERASGRELHKTFDESRIAHDMVETSGSWPTPTGWQPTTTLARGIDATYRWFTDQAPDS